MFYYTKNEPFRHLFMLFSLYTIPGIDYTYGKRKSRKMKIEKVNDNQIRCTITLADLNDRHLKVSELITNTDKAKMLLNDVVQQAAAEFGFEVDGMSLMIETRPAAKDSVVFTITRLVNEDGANEIDNPFFGQPLNKLLGADSVADFFQELRQAAFQESQEQPSVHKDYRVFSFDTLEQVIQTARVFNGLFEMVTSLYKDPVSGCYLFVVYRGNSDNASFDRACNMLSEYAALEEADSTILAYVTEHGRPVLLGNALEQLAEL